MVVALPAVNPSGKLTPVRPVQSEKSPSSAVALSRVKALGSARAPESDVHPANISLAEVRLAELKLPPIVTDVRPVAPANMRSMEVAADVSQTLRSSPSLAGTSCGSPPFSTWIVPVATPAKVSEKSVTRDVSRRFAS